DAALGEAVEEGLVISVGAGSYRFLHDRVQQAVYGFLPEEERIELHRAIGLLLLARRNEAKQDEQDDRRFDLLYHLNPAAHRIGEPATRLTLAQLNLAA